MSVVNYGLLEAREKFKLTLRKQKIDDIIYERRDVSNSTLFIDNSDKKNYEIDPTKLKIDQELLKKNFNSLEDLILFTKYLITNDDDLDCIKFGIYLLRTSHSRTKNIPVEFLKKEGICDSLNKTLKKYFTELDIIVSILLNGLNFSLKFFGYLLTSAV